MGYPPNPMRATPPPGVPERALTAGQPVPVAQLTDDTGKAFALADKLQEKPRVLVFYRGHWCPHCRAQLADMQSNLSAFAAAGVGVAAISGEGAEDGAALRQKLGLTLDVWTDPDLALTKAMGIEDSENGVPWPAVYVIGRDGKVVWRWVAETYKVRPSAQDVLAHLPSAS